MKSGIEMLLSSVGIDPQDIVLKFTTLKDAVVNSMQELEKTNKAIFASQERMEQRQIAMQERQEEMWTEIRRALRMSSQIQLVPQPTLQEPQQDQQNQQPQPLLSQPTSPMQQP